MTRGRKPTPTAVKQLLGNPGKRPLNDAEPKPGAASGRAPHGLTPGANRFWRKYGPALAALGVLTEIDEPALRLMAEHFSLALKALRNMQDVDAAFLW